MIEAAARALEAGQPREARRYLDAAMGAADAGAYAGLLKETRYAIVRAGGYDEAPWAAHPDWCALCFLGECDGHGEGQGVLL